VNRWLIWTVFAIAWTVALEIPFDNPGGLPGGEFILTYRVLVTKGLHVAAYALFAILAGWASVRSRYRWLMMFFLMAHGTVTEILQVELEPYCHRGGKLGDVGFDNLGILIGVILSWKWWTRPDGPPV
jgi:VanZ family protein